MRRLLALAVAAGLLVWAAAPALSVQPVVPGAVDFEQRVSLGTPGAGAGAGAGAAARRVVTTPVLRAPKRFDLLGLRWSRARRSGVDASVRVRRDRGRWSRWVPLGHAHGAHGSDPVWAGGADLYQLRVKGRPAGLLVHFVNASGTATRLDRARTALRKGVHSAFTSLVGRTATAARTSQGQPAIVPRAAWGADQCTPRGGPSYGEVQMGFVHHTVSANSYGPEDSAAIVLSICRYHRNSNGWEDIGYNFLVDRYGRVFEGRAGGIDKAVIGAQAQGYNAVSTGVANIGTHSSEAQTPEGLEATAAVLAWKLPLHGVPVEGTVTVRSAGGSANRYPAGRPVTFQRISGHRDGDSTTCPGDVLYGQLPEIRRLAASRAPDVPAPLSGELGDLTLEAPSTRIAYGQPAQVGGRLLDRAGGPVGGTSISVQIRGRRGYSTVARTTTNGDGTWLATVPTRRNRRLRAIAVVGGRRAATSPVLGVEVLPAFELRAPRRATAGRPAMLRGRVRPAKRRLVLHVARAGRDGRFHTVARLPVRASRSGRFSLRVRLARPALTRLRLAFAGDRLNAPARSGDVVLRAVRARSRSGGTGARVR